MAGGATPDGAGGDFRSGLVALAGRPSVGKSTLLNALVGQVVAIATPLPQTTRCRIRGIVNRPSAQIVLVDTPGIHDRDRAINRFMLGEAKAALADVDLVVVLVEASGRGSCLGSHAEDRLVLECLRRSKRPALLAINKIDALANKAMLLPIIDGYNQTGLFSEIIPISALHRDGLERLLKSIEEKLPAGPRFFPDDTVTDQTERSLAGELIREQVILRCGQEVPYSTAVEVVSFEDLADRNLVRIAATIFVEHASQKGIVIGKGGRRLRDIGTAARHAIEDLMGSRVFLDLRVKVAERWSHSEAGLRSVGYTQR